MYGGVCDGAVGVYEGTKKVLVVAYYSRAAYARYIDCVDARVSSRTLRVHLVLAPIKNYSDMTAITRASKQPLTLLTTYGDEEGLRTDQRDLKAFRLYL